MCDNELEVLSIFIKSVAFAMVVFNSVCAFLLIISCFIVYFIITFIILSTWSGHYFDF